MADIINEKIKHVDLYSDGSCSGNPGPGGWGCILIYKDTSKEFSGGLKQTTNNRMELTGIIEGLKHLKEPCVVNVYTDSAYVCNAIEKQWLTKWTQNGWKTSAKKDVENIDLWKELLELLSIHKVTFHKVKGHADNSLNNRCDKLATQQTAQYRNN